MATWMTNSLPSLKLQFVSIVISGFRQFSIALSFLVEAHYWFNFKRMNVWLRTKSKMVSSKTPWRRRGRITPCGLVFVHLRRPNLRIRVVICSQECVKSGEYFAGVEDTWWYIPFYSVGSTGRINLAGLNLGTLSARGLMRQSRNNLELYMEADTDHFQQDAVSQGVRYVPNCAD